MVSSSPDPATADEARNLSGPRYFEACKTRVDWFAGRHFTWPGTLRLHRSALGWDILWAPINVLLSPVLVLVRVAAYLCRRAGWRAGADWLTRRRIVLRTSVAQRVETLIVTDLLDLQVSKGAAPHDPSALARTVLTAPQFREMIRTRPSAAEAEALGRRIADTIGEYASTRAAVAEMTTTLCVLVVGAVIFQAVTPGMISMAPSVAAAMARTNAISTFPLGQTLGGLWYGVFDASASPWQIGATVAGLVMIGSVVAAFAGVVADPVQVRLGIHRRRLRRLIDALETETLGRADKPFVAREHFYARFLDLWDAAASVARIFRN